MPTIRAKVSFLWEPYGPDLEYEPGSDEERGHLANVVKLCGHVHDVLSELFPKEQHGELLDNLDVEIETDNGVVLTSELNGALNTALAHFDVTYGEYLSIDEAKREKVHLNVEPQGNRSDDAVAIHFTTAPATTGLRQRYYILTPEGTYCCNTSSLLLANGQPVRANDPSGAIEGEARVHVRALFQLVPWPGDPES